MKKPLLLLATLACLGLATVSARADIVINPTTDTTALGNALAGGATGIQVTNITLSSQSSNGANSIGTYTLTESNDTYGLFAPGVVISTGDVADYETGDSGSGSNTTDYGVAATPEQTALLSPISGQDDHFDVTQLTITFNQEVGFDTVFFNVVFGSEEFPEFVEAGVNDAFGLFLNGENIAFVNGLPVNIDHPDFEDVSGTELDGVLQSDGQSVITFSGLVGGGTTGNTLTFILADSGDSVLDTTIYISSLGGTPPPAVIPEPSTLVSAALGSLVLSGYLWRRRKTSVA